MAKIITFIPPDLNKDNKKGEVIGFEKDSFMNHLKRCEFSINRKDWFAAIQNFNKALDKSIEMAEFNRYIWGGLLENIYVETGNPRLLIYYYARKLVVSKNIYVLLNMWASYNFCKQKKQARILAKYLVKNGLVQESIFDERNFIMPELDYSNNVDVMVNKVIDDINAQKFHRAFKRLHFAYMLDRTDPFVCYLYHNADEAFSGKINKSLPELYIMKRLKEIEKATEDDEAFKQLWAKDDHYSLMRFLTNYGSIGLNEKFHLRMLKNINFEQFFYAEHALFTDGKSNLKKQLMVFLLVDGVVKKICIVHSYVPRIVSLSPMQSVTKLDYKFRLSIMEALSILLDVTDCYELDITYEINAIIKGANEENKGAFNNINLIRDMLVYYYLIRRDKKTLKKLFTEDNANIIEIMLDKFNIKTTVDFSRYKNILHFKARV